MWALLFALACGAIYLSVANFQVDRQHRQISELSGEITLLAQNEAYLLHHPHQWVVRAHRAIPMLALFGVSLPETSLPELAAKLGETGQLTTADTRVLQWQLSQASSTLGVQASALSERQTRLTHYFYWVLLALVCVVMWGARTKAAADHYIGRLLRDDVLFKRAPVGVVMADSEDYVVRVNDAYQQMCGYDENEILGNQIAVQSPEGMYQALREQGVWLGEQTTRRKDGELVVEKVMRLTLGDQLDNPKGYLTIFMEPILSDDQRRLMLWQAHHDNLTKLPNANLLHERLVRGLSSAVAEQRQGALISIDIDGFQQVNDSVGHERADRVLTDVAYRIAMCARENDTVARLGGDLFVIALFEMDGVAEAEQIARAAIKSFEQPVYADEQEIFLTASAGIIIFPDDGVEKGELLQKADAARLQAKKRGGNQLAFFEEDMNAAAARRLEIETHLRKALERDELELYYQPVVNCVDDTVYGAEALLRWNSQELGFVSPGEFIPVAESCNLIVEIGEWVASEVGQRLTEWQSDPELSKLRVSLNVSARQFSRRNTAQRLLEVLDRAPTETITVEITESALVTDDPGAALFLDGLKERGLRMALDDFGTGFSSIGYLRDFEFDVLKVDKSFIDSIESSKDLGLVASIVAMGRILGMKIVAEGVEEKAQVDQLKRIGCDYIQGYFYARPMPLPEFLEFLSSR